jgi:hypothetical protein
MDVNVWISYECSDEEIAAKIAIVNWPLDE